MCLFTDKMHLSFFFSDPRGVCKICNCSPRTLKVALFLALVLIFILFIVVICFSKRPRDVKVWNCFLFNNHLVSCWFGLISGHGGQHRPIACPKQYLILVGPVSQQVITLDFINFFSNADVSATYKKYEKYCNSAAPLLRDLPKRNAKCYVKLRAVS